MLVKLKTNKIDFKATGIYAFIIILIMSIMTYAFFKLLIWFLFIWLPGRV